MSLLCFEACAAGRLAPVDLEVDAGCLIVLAADVDDGVGSLLTCALGLSAPRRGRVTTFGLDVARADHDALRAVRERAALASMQAPLLSNLSVRDNLLVPLAMRSLPEARALADVEALLVDLGLAGLMGRRPHELTLRQHRELVLARALLLPVPLYLLDDPPLSSRLLGRLPQLAAAGSAVVVTSTSERLTTALSSPPSPPPGASPPTFTPRVVRLPTAPAEEVA